MAKFATNRGNLKFSTGISILESGSSRLVGHNRGLYIGRLPWKLGLPLTSSPLQNLKGPGDKIGTNAMKQCNVSNYIMLERLLCSFDVLNYLNNVYLSSDVLCVE